MRYLVILPGNAGFVVLQTDEWSLQGDIIGSDSDWIETPRMDDAALAYKMYGDFARSISDK